MTDKLFKDVKGIFRSRSNMLDENSKSKYFENMRLIFSFHTMQDCFTIQRHGYTSEIRRKVKKKKLINKS